MAFMAVLVMKVVLAVSGVFIAQYAVAAATGMPQQSVSSMAMLQGGIGLLLTIALVGIPPVAASFFGGTLGNYMAYSVFGGNPGAAAGQRPGEQGYRGAAAPVDTTSEDRRRDRSASEPTPTQMTTPYSASQVASSDTIKQGRGRV
jgi:type IV secretion system protein VirB6